MRILSITALLCLFVLTSCCSAKKNKTETTVVENNTEAKSMMEQGYLMGEIIASKAENDCPYVIKSDIEDGTVMYDPINLDAAFMKGGTKVWYKYNGLRMMNRCEKANPVSLVDMKPQL
jgi:hypothetical protein